MWCKHNKSKTVKTEVGIFSKKIVHDYKTFLLNYICGLDQARVLFLVISK